jgi:hypothetical protein
VPSSASAVSSAAAADRNVGWERCRNALGIARLLVEEGRSVELVSTACHLSVDCACRVAMDEADLVYDGDPGRALARLAAPRGLWPIGEGGAHERLRATERIVEWLAAYLKSEAPHHSWGV